MTDRDAKVPVVFGEVLFDRFPGGEEILGGAPFNVAWNLHALGARPRFVSRVGEDALGEHIRSAMTAWGMDTSGLQIDPDHGTGTVTVTLEDGDPQFAIDADKAYDFIAAGDVPSADAGLLYHGTLALRSTESRRAFDTLAARIGAPTFVDVNLRAPWWSAEDTRSRLRSARWAKLNESELAALAPSGPDLDPGTGLTPGAHERVSRLMEGTSLETLIVTYGADGAEVHGADGENRRVSPPREIPVIDTVGAGDAFSSVVILGLLRGWSWPTTLDRAQGFAAAVVGLRGATTANRAFYDSASIDWENP